MGCRCGSGDQGQEEAEGGGGRWERERETENNMGRTSDAENSVGGEVGRGLIVKNE